MAPGTPEERMARTETDMTHVKETLGDIRSDLKGLPAVLRRQIKSTLRSQRVQIKADIERAVDECRKMQMKDCNVLRAAVKAESNSAWDFSWLKQVLIGLAIIGSLIGGAIAALRGGDHHPIGLPSRPPTVQGGQQP